ncbi:MAG: restriction endonuclease subunit S [Christensenellales bacterium]
MYRWEFGVMEIKKMRVRDICVGIADGSHNPPQGIEMSDYLMLSSKNIFDDEITFDNPRYLAQSDFEQEDRRTKVMAGNVLLTIVGTVGRAAVVDEKMPRFTLQRSVAVLKPKDDVCNSRYLMYALQGKRTYIENSAKGVAQKGIYLNEVSNIDLRIPA